MGLLLDDTIWIYCKIYEVFFSDKPCPSGRGRGAWSHVAVLLKENPKKRFVRHGKPSTLC